MSFTDIQKTRDQIIFDEGFEEGRTLSNRQLWFLQNTTIRKMRFKKYKDLFNKLFNFPYDTRRH